ALRESERARSPRLAGRGGAARADPCANLRSGRPRAISAGRNDSDANHRTGPAPMRGGNQLPPAFLGVVVLRLTPFDGFDAAFFPPSSSSFLPRMRSAAARSRPPTPLAFGFSPLFASPSALARGLNSLPRSSTCATSALSPRRKPRRSR